MSQRINSTLLFSFFVSLAIIFLSCCSRGAGWQCHKKAHCSANACRASNQAGRWRRRKCVLTSLSTSPAVTPPGGNPTRMPRIKMCRWTSNLPELWDAAHKHTNMHTHARSPALWVPGNPHASQAAKSARRVERKVVQREWRCIASIFGSLLTSILRQGCRGAVYLLSLAPLKAQNSTAGGANSHPQPEQLLLRASV